MFRLNPSCITPKNLVANIIKVDRANVQDLHKYVLYVEIISMFYVTERPMLRGFNIDDFNTSGQTSTPFVFKSRFYAVCVWKD